MRRIFKDVKDGTVRYMMTGIPSKVASLFRALSLESYFWAKGTVLDKGRFRP